MRQLGLADSSLTHVARAVRWIREHYASRSASRSCRGCGMSVSAFHRNFQAVTALSPIQFQKQIRLQESRLLLLTGPDDVATVGYRVATTAPRSSAASTAASSGFRQGATRIVSAAAQRQAPDRREPGVVGSRRGPLRRRVQEAAVALGVLAQPLGQPLRRAVEEALHAVADLPRGRPRTMAA